MGFAETNARELRLVFTYLQEREPLDEQGLRIKAVLSFAGCLVHRAERLEMHIESQWPSLTASSDSAGRWIEFLSTEDGYRLEFWDQNLLRFPDPNRVEMYSDSDAPVWSMAVAYVEWWLVSREDPQTDSQRNVGEYT